MEGDSNSSLTRQGHSIGVFLVKQSWSPHRGRSLMTENDYSARSRPGFLLQLLQYSWWTHMKDALPSTQRNNIMGVMFSKHIVWKQKWWKNIASNDKMFLHRSPVTPPWGARDRHLRETPWVFTKHQKPHKHKVCRRTQKGHPQDGHPVQGTRCLWMGKCYISWSVLCFPMFCTYNEHLSPGHSPSFCRYWMLHSCVILFPYIWF